MGLKKKNYFVLEKYKAKRFFITVPGVSFFVTSALFVFTHEKRWKTDFCYYGLRVYTIVNVKEQVRNSSIFLEGGKRSLVVRETVAAKEMR